VAWVAPQEARGRVTSYIVSVYKTGHLVRERDRLVTASDPVGGDLAVWLEGLEQCEGCNYSVEVVAKNREERSAASERVDFSLNKCISEVKVVSVHRNNATLAWDYCEPGSLDQAIVSYRSSNPLDLGRNLTVKQGQTAVLQGLAPGTQFSVTVVGLHEGGTTEPASTLLTTAGTPLPTPILQSLGLGRGKEASVKLSWSREGRANYTYGVWYGVSEGLLVSAGPRLHTGKLLATVGGLGACTTYLFSVAVDDEAAGLGQMGSLRNITTKWSPLAPPRNLSASGSILTWSSPCDTMEEEVSYIIERVDLYKGDKRPPQVIVLNKVRNTTIRYELPSLEMGSRLSVTVRVKADSLGNDRALPSNSVIIAGASIPTPTSVYVHVVEGKFQVSWARVLLPSLNRYKVVLSPDETFSSHACDVTMDAGGNEVLIDPSQLLSGQSEPSCVGIEEFYVGVRAVLENGYMSGVARAGSPIVVVSAVGEAGEIVVPESSAVGTAVAVLLVVLTLGAGVAYLGYNNRLLKRRFREFTSGRYMIPGASASVNHCQLIDEDDDSPIIRGFSDDEPLVMS